MTRTGVLYVEAAAEGGELTATIGGFAEQYLAISNLPEHERRDALRGLFVTVLQQASTQAARLAASRLRRPRDGADGDGQQARGGAGDGVVHEDWDGVEPQWWSTLGEAERATLRRTSRETELDRVDDEIAIRNALPHSRVTDPEFANDYDVEVDLGNGHVWRRRHDDAMWCRYSVERCVERPPGLAPNHEFGDDRPLRQDTLAFRREHQAQRDADRDWTGELEAQWRGWPQPGDDYRWELRADGRMRIVRRRTDVPRLQPDFNTAGALVAIRHVEATQLAQFRDSLRGLPSRAARWSLPTSPRDDLRRLRRLHQQRAQARHARDTEPDAEISGTHHGRMTRTTERIGELGADAWVRAHFPGAERIYPRTATTDAPVGSGTFDLVYAVPRGAPRGATLYLVIEAKGGGARLGVRAVDGEEHQQGTRRYFEEIRRMMQRRQGDPDAVQAARALRSADPSNVRYILLHTRFSEATPASFVVHAREFELDTPN